MMTSCELVKSSGFYNRNGIGYDNDRIAIGEYYFMNSLTITVPETAQALDWATAHHDGLASGNASPLWMRNGRSPSVVI